MLDSDQLDEIFESILRGRTDSFVDIVSAYGPGLRVFLGTRLFHLDDIDDLAQEIFITAYRRLNTFRRGEDFGSWLRGIARNKLYHYYEKNNRQSKQLESFREEASILMEEELSARADAADAKGERIQAMMNCIALLPDRIRHVIRAQLDGRKAPSMAEELKTTTGAVYQLQYRGLGLLRDCMKKEAANG